jgi:3-oxo-5-alpha-steroid 4-dehydrogenase 1
MNVLHSLVRQSVETYIFPYSTALKTTWLGLAVLACGILSTGLLKASYGRHFHTHSIFPNVDGKLGWLVQEIVSPVTIVLFYQTFKVPGPGLSVGLVLLALWLFHYSNRAVVSVLLAPGMKETRLDTVLMSVFFNLVNAGWAGYDVALLNAEPFTFSSTTSVGLVMFATGMAINISSDYYLQGIRRRNGDGKKYVLPDWGLYKYILSPNYAGETLEWIGFAVVERRESGWAFVLWTICNLWPRARTNLAWYKEKFGDKVGNRTSLIPGVL